MSEPPRFNFELKGSGSIFHPTLVSLCVPLSGPFHRQFAFPPSLCALQQVSLSAEKM